MLQEREDARGAARLLVPGSPYFPFSLGRFPSGEGHPWGWSRVGWAGTPSVSLDPLVHPDSGLH